MLSTFFKHERGNRKFNYMDMFKMLYKNLYKNNIKIHKKLMDYNKLVKYRGPNQILFVII